MTPAEKQIPAKVTSPYYLKELFNDHIKDIDPQGDKILNIKTYKIKDYFGDDFFHFVLQNNVRIGTNKGLRKRYKIFCASFSGHGRKKMYQVLDLVYKHGFSKGDAIVPTPLWYIDDLMAAFYIGVPGENFLEHIKNGYLDKSNIERIAKGLANFHKIEPTSDIKLSKHEFSLKYLDPTDILKRDYNKDTSFTKDILAQLENLKSIQLQIKSGELKLSHGDFHPENVIVNKFNTSQIAIIDFSESCLAPIYYDISSFLQQFEFMTKEYLDKGEYKELEKIFLQAYFGEDNLNKDILDHINLYKAWTALKSAVYFAIFTDELNKKYVKYLLNRSKELSGLI